MMDGRGDVRPKRSETRGTNTGSARNDEGRRPTPRRGAMEEDEDLSHFVNNMVDQAWESIQERMRQPLTKNEVIRESKRLISVVCELVFQLRVPALVEDQVLSEEAAIRSFELQSHGEEEEEEESQSTYNRSSPIMVRPVAEDHPQENRSGKKSADDRSNKSDSQVSVPEVVQQVNQSPTAPSAHTPPPEISAEASAEQAQEQVTSATIKSSRRTSRQCVKQFLETVPEKVVSVIIESLDICEEKTEGGVETFSDVKKILKLLAIRLRYPNETEEDMSDLVSLDETAGMFFCCFWYLHKTSSSPQSIYPVTVSSRAISIGLSSKRFRRTSLMKLNEYLMTVSLMFPSRAITGGPYTSSLAKEMLDIVINSVHQLSQPQPRKYIFPCRSSDMTTVSEDQVASAALMVKHSLKKKLQKKFLKVHKHAAGKWKKGETETEKRASPSRSIDQRAEGTQEGNVMLSSHSPVTAGLCESAAESMARAVRSFLVETELLLKQDYAVQCGVAAVTKLEKMVSLGRLSVFSKLLTDKIASEFNQQLSRKESPVPSRKVWSDSELICPTRRVISPPEGVYIFVEEAVKHLLSSFVFPPPSWGMGHAIQVQSSASPAAQCTGSVEKYEAAISSLTQLMVNQAMGQIDLKAAAGSGRSTRQ